MIWTFIVPIEFATVDAIQRALYRIADQADWNLAKNEGWEITLTAKTEKTSENLESIFRQHLVDYSLREKIREETAQVRSLLLAHAFSHISQQLPDAKA